MRSKKNSKGFTLIELVVTTAIMGTLAAVAIPSYLETQAKAKTNKTVANMSNMGTNIGKRFNELAGEFGTIQVAPNTTEGGTDVDTLFGDYIILKYGAGGTATSQVRLDDIVPEPPKSPFGNLPYVIEVVSHGSVDYVPDDDGSITVNVTKAQISVRDQEDPDLKMTFSY